MTNCSATCSNGDVISFKNCLGTCSCTGNVGCICSGTETLEKNCKDIIIEDSI